MRVRLGPRLVRVALAGSVVVAQVDPAAGQSRTLAGAKRVFGDSAANLPSRPGGNP